MYIKDTKSLFGLWHHLQGAGKTMCGKDISGDIAETLPDGKERDLCFKCAALARGFDVETIQGGQVRRYGPTVHEYRITDLRGSRDKDEVLAFCRQFVQRAALKSDENYHPLIEHVQIFKLIDAEKHIWKYPTGHEYTG